MEVPEIPFQLVEDIAIADACFDLSGNTLEELFCSAFYALMETMVVLETVEPEIKRSFVIKHNKVEGLLFDFLEELIFLKDAESIIFNKCNVKIDRISEENRISLKVELEGRNIDETVKTITDVKAITMYQFYVKKVENGWKSRIVFDL